MRAEKQAYYIFGIVVTANVNTLVVLFGHTHL